MNTTQKEKGKKIRRIFLSYAAADREHGHKLRRLLLSRRLNLQIFVQETLSAGENWKSILKDKLSQCDIFLVILSSNSVNSEWVLSELGAAWALDKVIIAVITHRDVLSKIPVYLREDMLVDINYLEKHPEAIDQILESYD